MRMKLGFAGLGIMGTPMALNLLKGGHELVVWNRTPGACEALRASGAQVAGTPAALAAACEVTFAMLADPEAALAVACGPGGIREGLAPGGGYVDMSTVDPGTSLRIATALTAAGARFLEAPVSGSRQPAEQGQLVIMAAGDRALYDEIAPVLDLLGKRHLFLGEAGCAARMKLVVNLVMGGMMTAFAEGLALSRSAGLEPGQVLEVLDAGALANPMFRGKGPRMLAGDFDVAFPLKHMAKDLRLAAQLATTAGVETTVGAAAGIAYGRALASGDGDLDFSAVLRSRGPGGGRSPSA
jgi:3-hydroxyisobutyrate dehydrogenase-like beta-hydroxyacid dehydrogenase